MNNKLSKMLKGIGGNISKVGIFLKKAFFGMKGRFKKVPLSIKLGGVYLLVIVLITGVFAWRASRYYPEIPLGKEGSLNEGYVPGNLPDELRLTDNLNENERDVFLHGGDNEDGEEDVVPVDIIDIGSILEITPIWPIKGVSSAQVAVGFGEYLESKTRSGLYYWAHQGIDIVGGDETPVLAVWDGKVVDVKDTDLKYGTSILVEHVGNVFTFYGNIEGIKVKVGDEVTQGQSIGIAGQKAVMDGDINEPYLHFEVRIDGKAVDPLNVLP